MSKIKLDIKPVTKTVTINKKEIKIPKLGLKHYNLSKQVTSPDKNMKIIMDSIHPNLSKAERDLVTLHLLEFNNKIKSSVIKDGFEYSLDSVYICQVLKFSYGDLSFKFKSPSFDECFLPVDQMLKACCVSVHKDGNKIEIPDFMELPAFTYKWAEQINLTVAIDGPNGPIKGLTAVLEIFGGDQG